MDRIKVHLALTNEGEEYQRALQHAAEEICQQLRLELEVSFADGNGGQQVANINAAIREEAGRILPKAVIMEPVALDGMRKLYERIVAKGIALVIINGRAEHLEELRSKYPTVPIFIIGNDQHKVGEIQGAQAIKLLPQGGRILYLTGRMDSSAARERAEGFYKIINVSGVYRVTERNSDWTAAGGERVANTHTEKSDDPTLIVVCQNDEMAKGIRSTGKFSAQTPIIGCDGLREGKKMVADGSLQATVAMVATSKRAIEDLVGFLDHGTMPPLETLLTPEAHPQRSIN